MALALLAISLTHQNLISWIGSVAMGAYYLSLRNPKLKSGPFSPDAEKEARAKFMPSTDHPSDDAAIYHDRRHVKPGDRRPRPARRRAGTGLRVVAWFRKAWWRSWCGLLGAMLL